MSKTYVKFSGGNGYCGCDYTHYVAFDEKPSEDELNSMSDDYCRENAEDFDYCGMEEGFGGYWSSEEEQAEYEEDCYGHWEIVSKEEFDEYSD